MPSKITFKFEDENIPEKVVDAHAGDSVLDSALDSGIDLHHNCGAVCACSTCHVYINNGMSNLPEITDKEDDFIDRAINPTLESRLACQCILEDDKDYEITIPDQNQFNGH